jgi:hypothetical protein
MDRMLHHATTLNLKGESCRLKEKRRAGLFGRKKGQPQAAEKEVKADNPTVKAVDT